MSPQAARNSMKITVEILSDGIKKIALFGRMDIDGAQSIDLKLTFETAAEKSLVIMDLSNVDFMSSIGIGSIVRSSKSLRLRGGNIVLFNPQPVVTMVLEATQINKIIPICFSLEDARKSLLSATS
jgi:anti-sigma B factor antagonist